MYTVAKRRRAWLERGVRGLAPSIGHSIGTSIVHCALQLVLGETTELYSKLLHGERRAFQIWRLPPLPCGAARSAAAKCQNGSDGLTLSATDANIMKHNLELSAFRRYATVSTL
eukprot:4637882-Pleurochrysis_carterae.AAC.5